MYNDSAGSLFGARNTDASSTVPATSRSHTSPPSDRAPVQAGLYDDLPPPGDWEEEEVPHIQVGVHKVRGQRSKLTQSKRYIALVGYSRNGYSIHYQTFLWYLILHLVVSSWYRTVCVDQRKDWTYLV